ncbi:22816_t:CDS:2, partial [Cetraspora pellucida]
NENESNNFVSVWAIGIYSVECEECEIEIILFVAIDLKKRDFDIQAVFEKNEFYSVGGKIVPRRYNNIAQEIPREVSDDENAVFDVLVSNYAGQDYKFTVKVAYLYLEPRFSYIKNVIRSQESIVFVVGQMELIDDGFFIYAKDINNIDINKIKISDDKKVVENKLSDEPQSPKHLRTDYMNEQDLLSVENANYLEEQFDRKEKVEKKLTSNVNKSQMKSGYDGEKDKVHLTRSTTRNSDKLTDSIDEE